MLNRFLYSIFGLLFVSLNLIAEDNQLLNAMYLVPEDSCEYVTRGEIKILENHLQAYTHSKGNGFSIYYDSDVHFYCDFGAPKGQILQPGIYKNAERMPCSSNTPSLNISGFGRGYNSINGEFEIFEIQYDENYNIISLAADFRLDGDSGNSLMRGAIRFNSSYPINEFFAKMIDPSINWESQQLFYVRKFNKRDKKQNDLIVKDRTKLSVSIEENNGFNLIVDETQNCGSCNQIKFHIPILSEISCSRSFTIQPAFKHQNWDDESCGNRDNFIRRNPSISLAVNMVEVTAFQGYFIISDLVFDVKNNKIRVLPKPKIQAHN